MTMSSTRTRLGLLMLFYELYTYKLITHITMNLCGRILCMEHSPLVFFHCIITHITTTFVILKF